MKFLNFTIKAFIVFAFIFSLNSCNKEKQEIQPQVEDENSSKNLVEELADVLLSDNTPKEDSTYFYQYLNLSQTELEKFNEAFLAKTEKMMVKDGIRELTKEERKSILRRTKEVNNISMRYFNKSYITLSSEEQEYLEKKQLLSSNDLQLRSRCNPYYFRIKGREAKRYNTSCSYVGKASTPNNPNDCDYQLKFDYWRGYIGVAANSYLLHWIFKYRWNNYKKLILRISGQYVYLLIGNGIRYLIPANTEWYLKRYVKLYNH